MTARQEAVLRIFLGAKAPLTPQEVLERLRDDMPGAGLATVYRAIRKFLDIGKIRLVDIQGEPPRYEATGRPHHHHFYCRVCGRVFEVQRCPPRLGSMVPDGFQLEDHTITLYGLCPDCQEASDDEE